MPRTWKPCVPRWLPPVGRSLKRFSVSLAGDASSSAIPVVIVWPCGRSNRTSHASSETTGVQTDRPDSAQSWDGGDLWLCLGVGELSAGRAACRTGAGAGVGDAGQLVVANSGKHPARAHCPVVRFRVTTAAAALCHADDPPGEPVLRSAVLLYHHHLEQRPVAFQRPAGLRGADFDH